MDRRERAGDLGAGILAALEGLQAGIWTALPGIIQGVNFAKQTCVVQPALRAKVQQPDGSWVSVVMPLLVDCPLHWPKGGGLTLTFPVTRGDECLVIFASRCIDAWWQSGGVQEQAEFRMHDLSDGFALAGFSSVPSVVGAVSQTEAQLRNDAGTTFVGVSATDVRVVASGNARVQAGGNIVAQATGSISAAGASISASAPVINLVGVVNITGRINLTAVGGGSGLNINGFDYINHHHVEHDGFNTGGVIP